MGIFLLFLLPVVALLLVKIKFKITSVENRTGFFTLEVYLLFIRVYKAVFYIHFRHYVRLEIIKVKRRGFKKTYSQSSGRNERTIAVFRLIKSGDVQEFNLCLRVGTGDAAFTAILCGILSSAIQSVCRITGLPTEKVEVRPNFINFALEIFLIGIFRFSFADIIIRFFKEKRRKYASNRKHLKYNHV